MSEPQHFPTSIAANRKAWLQLTLDARAWDCSVDKALDRWAAERRLAQGIKKLAPKKKCLP